MSYTPTTWHFTLDEKGDRIYDDHILNVVQQNLLTLSTLVDDIKTDATFNIIFVQGWANSKTIKDPTVQTIALFASKIIEGLGVVFTAGTPAAIISTIVCKIVSGLITHFGNPQSKDTYNQLQAVASDLKLSLDKYCNFIQEKIAFWLNDLQVEWNTEIVCEGNKYPQFKSITKLSDLAIDTFLPKKGTTDYVHLREGMDTASKYEASAALIPVRWKIRRHRGFPPDGVSNFICGWLVEWYKVRGRGTWDSWRGRSDFPKIPSDLSGDIEGPFEALEASNVPYGKQRFISWNLMSRDYDWSDGERLNDSKQWNGTHWMGFSGRHYPYKFQGNDLVEGTSFLDVVEDILSGVYTAEGQWVITNSIPNQPSYYLWYKTKRPNEGVEIINDRRNWTLLGNWACQDWAYDSNSIFTWGRAYRGITLNHYSMVDENGNYAPAELCHWLFKDNGHGQVKNDDAVATLEDVYHGWGLNFE